MPDNNIAILSLVSKFDEKSARKAAEQANTTYENAMKKLGDTKFADAIVDEFNKALKAIDGKLKGVKLSSYQNDVLESLFSDKTVAEKTQSIENFTKKIFALNKALSGLPANSFDGLSTKQLDVIIGRQEKIIEKQDEIERKEATVRAKANRTARTERDYGSIEKKYGNKDYTEMSKSVQSALKGQKDFTKEQLASIDNFSKILNLYSQMESIQPEKGTEEAISYTRDLLTVTKELKKARDEVNSFTDNKASAYISKNYAGVNKVDNQSLYTAKTNFVNRELSSLNSQKAKMERELNTYIGETVQKNIEKRVSDTENVINVVEKKTNDLNQRIENLNKNSKNLKNTTDDLSNANQQLDNVGSQNSDDLRLMNQALEEIRDTYKDVAKYAVDAETAFSNLQSLMKTLQKKGGLDESEQKDFLGYATRLDSLKNNEIVPDDSYSFKGDKLEDFESYYDRYLDKYNKLALRITDMTDDQIDAFNDLKKNNVNSISAQTSELKHQEIQVQKTAEAEKELKSVESENHINDNPKNVSLVVESEQALQNIKSVKENLDNLPENKTIKITVENNDYSSTPLLSDEEGRIVTAYRGVKGVWSGLINDKDIAFFTDKIENAADYADSLAESGKVYKANLSFKNPLEVDGNGAVWDKLKVNLDGVERTTDQIVELARTLGKDGVIFKNIKDGFGEDNGGISNVMVALNRAQIKNEEVVAAVKAGSGEMTRIVNSDTTTSTVVGSQNEIQEELKETQNQAEKTTQALEKVNDATLLSSKTNISSESSSMEQVQKSTDQAVQAKEDFAKANVGVQASVNESKSPLQLEAELMDKIAESARKAADAKKEFVKANGKVAASAKESNVSLNSDLTSDHSEVSEPTGIKKYQKKGYKAHDTGNHDNEKKVVNKKELGNALKELQSEIIANIDSANSFIKDVTDFYDSNDNLVKTQMKVLDKNGNMSTYTTSYSMDKDGNATAWTSHIDSQKFEDKNQEYQNQLKTIRELSAEKQKLQEQDRKSEVNQALKDQLYAYKQIQSIREKIASTDDENLIAELEKQKQTYQEQYLTATKILKNNSDLYNSESRLNELLQIGLKTTQKISEAEIKRNSAADNKKVKEWDDVNAKNQADIWKENQKAIQNYVNAVKKLQDLLAEDKGTGSKAAAIEKQQEKIKQLEEEALNARAILSSMVNPHTSDASTWDAWVKMMDKLSNASHDAKAAVDDVKKSIQAAQASEIKSMNDGLAEYDAKMRSFNNRKPEDRSSDYSTALKNYTDALERYRNELQKIQNHPELINETEINNLKNMRQELDKAATSLKGIDKGSTAISRDKMISKISDYMKKNSAMSKEFKSELEGLIQKLKTLGAEADTTRIADEFFKITQRIREAGQEGKKFWDVVKEKAWYGLAGTIGTYFGFNDIIQYGKQAAQTIINLDTALVDLKKTTTMSSSQLKEFYFDANNVAKQMGVSTQQIIEQASAWSRLGYNTQQTATEMAKLSSQFASISPGMDTDTAQEGLVSIMKAWSIPVEDVKEEIMSNINQLGNTMAESNQDIVDGMERSAAALAAVGTSYKDAFALFSGMQEVLQSSEKAGTSLRSVALRLRSFDESTGEYSEDLQNITGKLIDLTKTAQHAQGVSVFKPGSTTEFKSLVDYFREIHNIWDEMSQKQQNDFLLQAFGRTQAQGGASLIKNFSAVEKALQEMEKSAGSSDREMATVEQSLEYKLNSLKETWVGTAQSIIDRGDLGIVIDGLTKISEVLGTLIDKIGLVKGAAIALGAALSFNNVGRGKMHPLVNIKFEYADSTYNLLWIQRFRTCQS